MSFLQKTKLYVLFFIAFVAISSYSQNPSTITFNVDGANTVVAKEIFGVLMERLGKQWGGGVWVGTNSNISNTNGMRNDIIEGFIECGIGAAEWPGGCAANGYNWSANKNPSNDVGVDRFIQFCKLTGAEAIIAGKPTANDAGSNEAFAKYIMNDLDYPLKWFKVGNEVWGCGGNQNVDGYIPNYTANYNRLNALKNTANGGNLRIVAANDIEGKWQWLPTMLNRIGSTIDGVEYHDYIYFPDNISSTNPSTNDYWTIIKNVISTDIKPHLDNEVLPDLNAYDPQKRIKLVLDEWGNWLMDVGDGWMQQNTVMDAVSAGLHLNMFVQLADRIEVACIAQGVNVIHSIMNVNNSGVMVKTPTFYVFKMLKPHHINNAKFLPMSASNIQTVNGGGTNMKVLNAAATVDDGDTVNISLTNIDLTTARQVRVTLNSSKEAYTVKSAEVVTGSNINSCNNFSAPEQVNVKTLPASEYSIDGKTLTANLPTKSVAMFRLVPVPTGLQNGARRNSSADDFSIKTGSQGTIHVKSSVNMKAPVTVSLYSADGRTLINRVNRTFESGTCIIGENIGKGVYMVKITGDNLSFTKQVVIAK
ncbi:MAG: T9SS type A sorting domain-containing protein [Fibrobacter sp.]|nr:T9SS type A sorting domain-containing protein [Fibrobacter sp.]